MAKSYVFKYVVLVLLKSIVILIFGKSHRSKYYLHALLIETVLLIVTLFFDLTNNRNVHFELFLDGGNSGIDYLRSH